MPHRILDKKGRKEESTFLHVYSFFTLAQIKFKFGQGNRTDIFMELIHLRYVTFIWKFIGEHIMEHTNNKDHF